MTLPIGQILMGGGSCRSFLLWAASFGGFSGLSLRSLRPFTTQ